MKLSKFFFEYLLTNILKCDTIALKEVSVLETTEILVQLLSSVNDLMNRVLTLEKQVEELKQSSEKSNSQAVKSSPDDYKVYQPRISKDSQRYLFNGIAYGKGRLVLAVIQQYAANSPGITADELESAFDGAIQGSIGVVRKLDQLSFYSSDPEKRFFLNQADIIRTSTDECAVCNQWSKYNINNFIKRAEELGFTISTI